MSTDRDPAVLIDIAIACQLVMDFVCGRSEAELDSDMLLQSAVLHQLLVLGEACRRLSDEFRSSHPKIEWSGYVGLRNVLIHQYDAIELDKVWKIATEEVPELRRQIDDLLPDERF